MKLRIAKEGDIFVVDEPSVPGTPPVGRGRSITEAMGQWLRINHVRLGIDFEVDPSAAPAELGRRRRELARR